VYNIFQTCQRSKQDCKSMHLRHNTSCSCVLSAECFPTLTGECQTTKKLHIYTRFVLFTHYHYFLTFSQNYLHIDLQYLLQQSPSLVYQLVKKFPTLYGTQNFITAVTSARHMSVSSARSIQPMLPIPLPEDPVLDYTTI
jgi:hypothetical protein